MPLEIWFYKKENGVEPIIGFLSNLDSGFETKAARDIELLWDFGNELREPYAKTL